MTLSWDFAPQNITPPVSSDVGTSLAVHDGKLYAAWKGSDGNQRVYYSSFDGHKWEAQKWLAFFESSVGVALAPYRGALYAMGRRGCDEQLHWSRFDGTSWTGLEWYARNHSRAEVSLVAYRGLLYLIWRGGGGDGNIYCSTYDGTAWAPAWRISNFTTNCRPASTVWDGQKLIMLWKGDGGDDKIYYSASDGKEWAPQQTIPSAATMDGPAITSAHGLVYAVWTGSGEDERIMFSIFNGDSWTEPMPVIGTTAGSYKPSLVVYNDELYITWKGRDNRLWWSRTPLNPGAVSQPVVSGATNVGQPVASSASQMPSQSTNTQNKSTVVNSEESHLVSNLATTPAGRKSSESSSGDEYEKLKKGVKQGVAKLSDKFKSLKIGKH